MPIPQVTRVNPLDLQGNIAIGVSLPFNGPAGPFNSTYSTKDQIKSNLINLLLTDKGERIMNPEFGCDLKKALFESITSNTTDLIKDLIRYNVNLFIPDITIVSIEVGETDEYNISNTISVSVTYRINISGTSDQITVQFI
jgi:phage baseplate assembly protein W